MGGPGSGLHISTVTLAELYTWALRSKAPPRRLHALAELLRDVVVLDITPAASRRFGELQAGLLDIGKPAPEMDLLIAATALVHDLTLVLTTNATTPTSRDYAAKTGLAGRLAAVVGTSRSLGSPGAASSCTSSAARSRSAASRARRSLKKSHGPPAPRHRSVRREMLWRKIAYTSWQAPHRSP
ncbi:MAG: type II toxin-antitoxin system VapC family toxin [Planctomycetia bacterium]|nr:type II toxin-antitoxin system VapC family toxin [Planctomycetia bacterium]